MKKRTSMTFKESKSDMASLNFHINNLEDARKWVGEGGGCTKTCKKVILEPDEENLNTQLFLDARVCYPNYEDNHDYKSNCEDNHNYKINYEDTYNYKYDYFNEIILLIFVFIVLQSICHCDSAYGI